MHFVLLQHGLKGLEVKNSSNPPKNATNLADVTPDWNETAIVCNSLDGLITVDTGIAHLSGSLNLPTAVILSPCGEWRWLDPVAMPEFESRCIWYDNVRLVRTLTLADYPQGLSQALLAVKQMIQRMETLE